MTQILLPNTIAPGQLEDAADVQENDEALRDGINGNLDAYNFTQATRDRLGLTDPTATRSGSSIITNSEAIASGAYTALASPDRVSNIKVPSGGLLHVSFWAMMVKSGGVAIETASVGLFLNGVQVRDRYGKDLLELGLIFNGLVPSATSQVFTVGAPVSGGFAAESSGAVSPVDNTAAGHGVGEFIPIRVNAGTYTVEVRWLKATGATITVSNRLLYVESRAY